MQVPFVCVSLRGNSIRVRLSVRKNGSFQGVLAVCVEASVYTDYAILIYVEGSDLQL